MANQEDIISQIEKLSVVELADLVHQLEEKFGITAAAPAAASGHGATAPASAAPVGAVPPGWVQIRAPSLGTFYRAPKPGAPKFVEVGATVTPESDLCLIEVMKLFTTLRSGVSGTVREVYVQDGELVEFDQPLFLIQPNA